MSRIAFPIVALHGSASSGRMWRGLGEGAAGLGDVFAPDLPGYGRNAEMRCVTPTGLIEAASAVAGLMEGPRHLIGHSFGGCLAAALADAFPARVLSLTVYEPMFVPSGWPSAPSGAFEAYAAFDALGRDIARASAADGMRAFLDYWGGAGAWAAASPEARARLQKVAGAVACDFAHALTGALSDLRPPYRGPSRLLVGEETHPIAWRMANDFAARRPMIERIDVPGAGHDGPFASAERVTPLLLDLARRDRLLAVSA